MVIENSTIEDIDEIFRLYGLAKDYQKSNGAVLWPEFDRDLVAKEILGGRQWKITESGKTTCVWATTFDDPYIWKDKNNDPSVYIHRIATNPEYRGRNLVEKIVSWSKIYAKENDKEFIRLDTVGENKKLIAHYRKNGFEFLGLFSLENSKALPAHYHNATVSLFELRLKK